MKHIPSTIGSVPLAEIAGRGRECLAIIGSCLAEVIATADGARARDDPEAIHDLRVAIRRLRAAMVILRKDAPSDGLTALGAGLRDLQQELGAAREWDVLIDETIGAMPDKMRAIRGMHKLIGIAEAQRAEGHRRARAALRSRKYAGFLLRLKAAIGDSRGGDVTRAIGGADAGTDAASRAFATRAAEVLRDRHRKVRALGKVISALDAQELHELRIRIKKLRYAAEFFREIWPGRRAELYLAALSRLQQVSGTAHDASVAIDMAGRLEAAGGHGISQAAGAVRDWAAKCLARDRKRLGRCWRKFDERKRFWKRS